MYNEYKSVFCFLDDNEVNYNLILEASYYATISYKGSYLKNKKYLNMLFSFIEENNYKILSDPIEIYKIDIHETSLKEEFITEIQIPIKR
ncbi:GyrI-like domain-containing protein [Clostridium rectalis]|uniref:GyrI-like domain-containing protein n=1 Tax=Clostridium rectalis TaxID=2040295 RepID=UPI001FAA52FA|nr:GyrI-like domain-containing protein [Clostridium rectalis]